MATCDEDGDCRAGYTCQDLSQPSNPWDAVLIDRGRGNKACVVPHVEDPATDGSGAAGTNGEFGDVCRSKLPTAAGTDDASGAGGAGGQSGG